MTRKVLGREYNHFRDSRDTRTAGGVDRAWYSVLRRDPFAGALGYVRGSGDFTDGGMAGNSRDC